MKRIALKSTVLMIALEVIVFAGVQVGAHNWLLSLSMKEKNLLEQQRELCWERNDLVVEISELLTLGRLEYVGGKLGLVPLPLKQIAVIELPYGRTEEGDADVAGRN